MWSQYYQDYVLWVDHYSQQPRNRKYTYIDVGTNDAVFNSNTYFFDVCLGWQGVCVEPQRSYHANILKKRTCEIVPNCISETTRNVQFVDAGGLAGIVSTNKNSEFLKDKRHRVEELTCVPLATVLKRRALRHVDVLNLDVEGHEIEVINSIDWNYTQIDVLVVESPPTVVGARVRWLLHRKGFRRHRHRELYISERLKWASPQHVYPAQAYLPQKDINAATKGDPTSGTPPYGWENIGHGFDLTEARRFGMLQDVEAQQRPTSRHAKRKERRRTNRFSSWQG